MDKEIINFKTRDIVRNAYLFSGAAYLSRMMNYLRGFLNARFLNPTGYGFWSAFNVFLFYGDFSHLGILQGMNREIAYIFKRDKSKVEEIQGVAFALIIFSSVIVAVLIILLFFIFMRPLDREETIGIFTIGILIILNNLIQFFESSNSAMQNFVLISKINSLSAFFSLALTLPIVFLFRIYGVFFVAFLTALYSLILYIRSSNFRFKINIDKDEAFKLFKVGFPLRILCFLFYLRLSLNSLMILGFMGKAALGLYSMALLIGRSLLYFPEAVGQVIVSRLYQGYGETGDIQDIKKYLTVPTQFFSYLLPLIAGLFYFLFSFLIYAVLPSYVESISVLFWLLFAFSFMMIPVTSTGFAAALDRQYGLIIFNLLAIFINLILGYLFLNRYGLGIKGVAFSVLITSVFYTTCVLTYNLKYYFKKFFEYLRYFIRLYLPTAYIFFITSVIMRLFTWPPQGFSELMLRFVIQVFLFLIFSLPVIILLSQRTHFLKWVREAKFLLRLKTPIKIVEAEGI